MHVNIVRYLVAAHFRTEGGIAKYEVIRNHARAQNLAGTVNVLDERIERVDALGQPLFEQLPFAARHDAWNDIERDQTFLGISFAINREGDPDASEDQFDFPPPVVEHVGRHLGEPAEECPVSRANAAVLPLHLVEGDTHTIPSLTAGTQLTGRQDQSRCYRLYPAIFRPWKIPAKTGF